MEKDSNRLVEELNHFGIDMKKIHTVGDLVKACLRVICSMNLELRTKDKMLVISKDQYLEKEKECFKLQGKVEDLKLKIIRGEEILTPGIAQGALNGMHEGDAFNMPINSWTDRFGLTWSKEELEDYLDNKGDFE